MLTSISAAKTKNIRQQKMFALEQKMPGSGFFHVRVRKHVAASDTVREMIYSTCVRSFAHTDCGQRCAKEIELLHRASSFTAAESVESNSILHRSPPCNSKVQFYDAALTQTVFILRLAQLFWDPPLPQASLELCLTQVVLLI